MPLTQALASPGLDTAPSTCYTDSMPTATTEFPVGTRVIRTGPHVLPGSPREFMYESRLGDRATVIEPLNSPDNTTRVRWDAGGTSLIATSSLSAEIPTTTIQVGDLIRVEDRHSRDYVSVVTARVGYIDSTGWAYTDDDVYITHTSTNAEVTILERPDPLPTEDGLYVSLVDDADLTDPTFYLLEGGDWAVLTPTEPPANLHEIFRRNRFVRLTSKESTDD